MNRSTARSLAGLTAAAVVSVLSVASAQEAQVALAGDTPEGKFLTDAVRGNIAEVKMGELAQERGQSEAIREYGMMLVDDHSEALKETAELAQDMEIVPPALPSNEQTAKHEALARLSGTEFDQQFAAEMVKAHQEAIAQYERQARNDDSKVARLAEKMLPTLREHLAVAQRLESGEHAAGHDRPHD